MPNIPAVPFEDVDAESTEPSPGIGLCLSGGGYRAMLFHVGTLLRLNEAGVLPQLNRVSSVSGGSITAALLGLRWKQLDFVTTAVGTRVAKNLDALVVAPLRRVAAETLDSWSIGLGIFTPGMTIGDFVARQYRRLLFGDATLQDLPNDTDGPRFVLNATSVQTGALVRFSRPYMADYLVGRILSPTVPLAVAVAASSAFPPVLSPVTVDVEPSDFEPDARCPLQHAPFNDTWVLADGGVYDNLGLESVLKRYKTVLVSDAGAKIAPEGTPASNWAEHSKRILDVIDNQVRSLRKRDLIAHYNAKSRSGAYWGIRTNIADYKLPAALPAPVDRTLALAATPTRLKALPELKQNQLMNWGYAVCDAALRKHATELLPLGFAAPETFPFSGGIG